MRRLLRDQYIGAVLLGLLLWNFFAALIKAVENPVMMAIQRWGQHSALAAGQPLFNKVTVIAELTDAGFFLLVILILGFWIYRPETEPAKA